MNPGIQSTATKKRKRPSYLEFWEDSLRRVPHSPEHGTQSPEPSKHGFSLFDLFGRNRWVCPRNVTATKGFKKFQTNSNHIVCKPSNFFTLRIEHRTGGAIAKHAGEERILIFRSDQAGAIAKIIFSSVPVHQYKSSAPKGRQDSSGKRQITVAANAKIHVLFVKDEYRGFDLGGLLFSLCTAYLRERYSDRTHTNSPEKNISMSSIRCRLDAEEDVCRHDKLVHFYEHLGLRRRKRAKPTFINNNDGKTYRRIPMKIDLLVSPNQWNKQQSRCSKSKVVNGYSSFLPALLVSSTGEYAKVDNRCIDSWLIVECQDGAFDLRTADGRFFALDCQGRCTLVPTQNHSSVSGTFQLLRISDSLDRILWSTEQGEKVKKIECTNEMELWMLRLSGTGKFLGLTADGNLILSTEASFWQVDSNFCLAHTFDSPARRQHHRRMWETQSVAYASQMRAKHATFSICMMSIKEALDLTRNIFANPFSLCKHSNLPSIRTLLFHTAELARKEGHPDWVQFVALVYGLAGALKYAKMNNSVQNKHGDYDWTIYVDSRVMGCKPSEHPTFHEFRHLNPDRNDPRYNTTNGMYGKRIGLENVQLSWTSGEYMYHMLRHNGIMLPPEAYVILKLFALVDWHKRGKYSSLSSEADEEVKPFVVDFYELFERSSQATMKSSCIKEIDDTECSELWANHYLRIANKYGAGGVLKW